MCYQIVLIRSHMRLEIVRPRYGKDCVALFASALVTKSVSDPKLTSSLSACTNVCIICGCIAPVYLASTSVKLVAHGNFE
jgi:hypothetical protein